MCQKRLNCKNMNIKFCYANKLNNRVKSSSIKQAFLCDDLCVNW
ncbi:hypothetical protein LMG7974_01454 [Campylobacter majalis]|uniref:Uncharacterized protein n=1 Tax=Campylobacter majalis TaxID=2790656 RepID=A0ABM8Q8M4_9BACT|nr:hypothetical protein LMG7974_01454 [Campylobacter majalis]